MALFKLYFEGDEGKTRSIAYYDSELSSLRWEDGRAVLKALPLDPSKPIKPARIEPGKKDIRVLKIQLGLNCNFECSYCNQKYVPRAEVSAKDAVDDFLRLLPSWFSGGKNGLGSGVRVEFWGGEPFVYWKTLKPLAERIKQKYPSVKFSVITNGSLLDIEKNDWLVKMGFVVSISHDGPAQNARGPDPLKDPSSRFAILDLYSKLRPKNRISFNSMLHAGNTSREDIQRFFVEATGDPHVPIGEGMFIDPYDSGGLACSLPDRLSEVNFSRSTYGEIRKGKATNFHGVAAKFEGFIDSLRQGTRLAEVAQKCGMDQPDNLAVDLHGNVLTCQNVSASATAPNGQSHKVGHVSDLNSVSVSTATHWSDRSECPNCPVIHLCKGACMFLQGDLWEAACNNAFADNIAIFAAAMESVTGSILVYIEGPQREDRKDIWGLNGVPVTPSPSKKVIPLVPA
jgi:uncharacterized protein